MNGRIKVSFDTAAESGRTLLIPFITAGDPDPAWTAAVMHALVGAGADLIELGVPFSDPIADGPVIQKSSERAIARQVNLASVLNMVTQFRQTDEHTPVVLMGYMNPILSFGMSQFPAAAATAGVDGLLLVDCPPEERGVLDDSMQAAGLDGICLVAPTTTRERVGRIAKVASGFIYYVSLKGITGEGQIDTSELADPIAQIREFSDLPVAVGFGIKNADMAVSVAANADAVVIGSALVQELAVCKSEQAACAVAAEFVAPVRAALDNMA